MCENRRCVCKGSCAKTRSWVPKTPLRKHGAFLQVQTPKRTVNAKGAAPAISHPAHLSPSCPPRGQLHPAWASGFPPPLSSPARPPASFSDILFKDKEEFPSLPLGAINRRITEVTF